MIADTNDFEDFDLPEIELDSQSVNPEPILSEQSSYSKACRRLLERLDYVQDLSLLKEEIAECENAYNEEAFWLFLEGKYFIGCRFEIYESTYAQRLSNFCDRFVDANEIDFIEKELELAVLQSPYDYASPDDQIQIKYSLKRRFLFLKDRLRAQGYILNTTEGKELSDFNLISFEDIKIVYNDAPNQGEELIGAIRSSVVKFSFTELEAVELIKALIVSGKVKANTEAEVFKFFGEIFGMSIDQKQKLQTIKKRSKDLTPTLDGLIQSMEFWIKNDG